MEIRFQTRSVLVAVLAAALLIVMVTAGAALFVVALAVAIVVALAVAAVRGVARLIGVERAPRRRSTVGRVGRIPRATHPDAIDVEHEVLPPDSSRR